MKVKFVEDAEIRSHGGLVEQSFGAGEVVELSSASARRWIRRNKAVEFFGDEPAVVKPAVPPLEGGHGRSPDSGAEKQPPASPPAPASANETLNTSGAPGKPADAASSSSTAPSSERSGPTSSTEQTPRGGGRRRTRRGSKG